MVITAILAVTLAAATVPGCSGVNGPQLAQQVQTLKGDLDRAQQALDAVRAQRDALDAVIGQMPDGEAKDRIIQLRDRAVTVADITADYLAKAKVALETMERKAAEATDVGGVIIAALESAAPVVPAPWGTLVGIAAAIAGGIMAIVKGRQASAAYEQAQQTAEAAGKVIRSVQPVVDSAIEASPALADSLRVKQGDAGAALVDAAQAKAI
jgi:outer membrane murein-binding lipoprotein Lpp